MKFVARNEGIASLWTVILITLFVAFTGLAIDTGYLVWTGQKLQIAAGAAALAGARPLRYPPPMGRPPAGSAAPARSMPVECRTTMSMGVSAGRPSKLGEGLSGAVTSAPAPSRRRHRRR